MIMGEPAELSPASRALHRAHAAKLSLVLFELVESGAWGRLAQAPATAEQTAAGTGLDPERLEEALDLLVQFELALREGNRFSLHSGAANIEPLIRLESELHRALVCDRGLAHWLRGAATADPLDGSPPTERVELYLRGFEAVSERVALGLWRVGRLADRRRLLDLGGAAGAQAAVFVRLGRELQVTVLDREIMRPFWRKRVKELEDASRIRFAAGDLTRPQELQPLLAAHDVVLLSNVLHLLPQEGRQALCEQILASCRPGTRLVVHDLFLDTPDQEMAKLMNVDWMLLGARFAMSTQQCADWLQGIGFQIERATTMPGLPSGVVVGTIAAPQQRDAEPLNERTTGTD